MGVHNDILEFLWKHEQQNWGRVEMMISLRDKKIEYESSNLVEFCRMKKQ